MSFRARLTLVAAAAVALAVVIASAVIYVVVRSDLRNPVDDTLRNRAASISRLPPGVLGHELFGPDLGQVGIFPQIVRSNGTIVPVNSPFGGASLPVTDDVTATARGHKKTFLSDVHVGGTHFRVLTFQYASGYAIELASPLTNVDRSLRHIRLLLLVIAIGGVAVASALGLLVSRAALAPSGD